MFRELREAAEKHARSNRDMFIYVHERCRAWHIDIGKAPMDNQAILESAAATIAAIGVVAMFGLHAMATLKIMQAGAYAAAHIAYGAKIALGMKIGGDISKAIVVLNAPKKLSRETVVMIAGYALDKELPFSMIMITMHAVRDAASMVLRKKAEALAAKDPDAKCVAMKDWLFAIKTHMVSGIREVASRHAPPPETSAAAGLAALGQTLRKEAAFTAEETASRVAAWRSNHVLAEREGPSP